MPAPHRRQLPSADVQETTLEITTPGVRHLPERGHLATTKVLSDHLRQT